MHCSSLSFLPPWTDVLMPRAQTELCFLSVVCSGVLTHQWEGERQKSQSELPLPAATFLSVHKVIFTASTKQRPLPGLMIFFSSVPGSPPLHSCPPDISQTLRKMVLVHHYHVVRPMLLFLVFKQWPSSDSPVVSCDNNSPPSAPISYPCRNGSV